MEDTSYRWYQMDELDELVNRIMRVCMVYLKPGDADKFISMVQEIRDYRQGEYEWQMQKDKKED